MLAFGLVLIALLASVGAVSASTLNLVQKDGSWNPIPGGASGILVYSYEGSAFTFDGTGLPSGVYSLISYEEPYPGTGSILLGTGTAVSGNIHIEGTLNLVLNTYPEGEGAKIWLVPSSDFTEGPGFSDWNPSTYLFETALINPGEIPVPEFPTMALPAALIIGLLGAVLFIQKSKE